MKFKFGVKPTLDMVQGHCYYFGRSDPQEQQINKISRGPIEYSWGKLTSI